MRKHSKLAVYGGTVLLCLTTIIRPSWAWEDDWTLGEAEIGDTKARVYMDKDSSLGAEIGDGRGRFYLDSDGTFGAELPVSPRLSLTYKVRPRGQNPSGNLQYKQKFR